MVNMQNFKKGHFFIQESKIFFFMGDESPYAHNSKSMIGFVPSAQHYSHPKFKIVKIVVNFWEGACELF